MPSRRAPRLTAPPTESLSRERKYDTRAPEPACHEDPEVAALSGSFPVQLLLRPAAEVLKLQQVFHRTVVVGIDGHPLRCLRRWINCVQADRDLAFQSAGGSSDL